MVNRFLMKLFNSNNRVLLFSSILNCLSEQIGYRKKFASEQFVT